MKNKVLRVGAIALAMIMLCGSTLPHVSADVEEVSAESGEETVESEVTEAGMTDDVAPVEVEQVAEKVDTAEYSEEPEESAEAISEFESPVTETAVVDADEEVSADTEVSADAEVSTFDADEEEITTTANNDSIVDSVDYTISGNTMTITSYKGTSGVLVVPKTCNVGGVTYNVLVDLNNSANTVTTLQFEDGYDLTASLETAKLRNDDGYYYTLFRHCQTVDLSNLIFNDASVSLQGWFFDCTDLQTVKLPSGLKIKSLASTFYGDTSLVNPGIDGADLSQCTSLNKAFYGCSSLTALNTVNWNVSNVTDMQNTFAECSKLTNVDLSNWAPAGEVTVKNLFGTSTGITDVIINGWNISGASSFVGDGVKNVTYKNCTFDYAAGLLNGASLISVTANNCVFTHGSANLNAPKLTDTVLDGCTFSEAKGMNIARSTTLKTIKINNCKFPALEGFDTSFYNDSALQTFIFTNNECPKATDLVAMFNKDKALSSVDFTGTKFPEVTTTANMFSNCTGLSTIDLSWLTENKLVDMDGMFSDCSVLTSVDFSSVDLSNVTNIKYLFANCTSLTSANFGGNTFNKVTDAYAAFGGCHVLKSLDVSKFAMENCTDFSRMFYCDYALEKLDVSNWKFSTSADVTAGDMFIDCIGLTSLDVSKWNTGRFINTRSMFAGCIKLTGVDVSNWDVSNVTNMSAMFSAVRLHYLDLSKWKLNANVDTNLLFSGSIIDTISTPDCSAVADLNEDLVSTAFVHSNLDNEQVKALYDEESAMSKQRYHKVTDKSEVRYLTSDLPAGTVLSRLYINYYSDKAKATLLNTEYPAYGTSAAYVADGVTWYDCDTDAAVSLNSVTKSMNVYNTAIVNGDYSGSASGDGGGLTTGGSTNGATTGGGQTSGGDQSSSTAGASGDQTASTTAATGNNDGQAASSTDGNGEQVTDAEATSLVQTGDATKVIPYVIILVIGISAVGAFIFRRYKRQ